MLFFLQSALIQGSVSYGQATLFEILPNLVAMWYILPNVSSPVVGTAVSAPSSIYVNASAQRKVGTRPVHAFHLVCVQRVIGAFIGTGQVYLRIGSVQV